MKDITANREAAHVSPCQPSRLAARSLASSPNSSSTPHCTFGNHIFKYSTNISFLLFSSLLLCFCIFLSLDTPESGTASFVGLCIVPSSACILPSAPRSSVYISYLILCTSPSQCSACLVVYLSSSFVVVSVVRGHI